MKRLIYILPFFLLFGCAEQQVEFKDQVEFDNYLNNPENGFINVNKESDLIFETKLTPPTSNSKNECTIQLRIKRKDGRPVLESGGVSKEQILEREGYLTFDVVQDVSLKQGKKYHKPVLHHYERNFGIKPSVDMYFVFDGVSASKEAEFRFTDRVFDQGLITIDLDKDLFNECYVAKN